MAAPKTDRRRPALAGLAADALAVLRHSRRLDLIGLWPSGPPEAPAHASAEIGAAARDSLDLIAADVRGCERCRLHASRTNAVPGEGPAPAAVMVIGEGPGATEDRMGRPFVGEAGRMLTNMLERVVAVPRAAVFIANMVKCRPPENRDPQSDEIEACRPFLERQIALVNPRLILVLGRVAAQNLLRTTDSLGSLRGKFASLNGRLILPTYHPAYLLRNPADKVAANQDLLAFKEKLAQLQGSAP